MSTHDKYGRPWAKLKELKVGDKLQTDGGMDCMPDDKTRTVLVDPSGMLCVICNEGEHNLSGQLADDENTLIGFYKVEA